jgi:hypothetical protein
MHQRAGQAFAHTGDIDLSKIHGSPMCPVQPVNHHLLAHRVQPISLAMRTEESTMPEKETIRRARKDKRQGKAPTTQAGEFVREEMHHVREGKHGARSTKQAIAIGLSKARRAGVKLSPPEKGTASEETRQSARHALQRSHSRRSPSARRSRAVRAALRREGHSAASSRALASQARSSARRRGPAARKAAAQKAARTRARKK